MISMASKSPVFPMPHPHHFTDYGFDAQFDYFQVLEEAKRFKTKESSSIDAFHLNNQSINYAAKKHRRRWWKTALFFFKSRWAHPSKPINSPHKPKPRPTSLSGPIYITESHIGPSTPFRAYSGPLTPARNPYLNLREINMHRISSPSPLPIYLVT